MTSPAAHRGIWHGAGATKSCLHSATLNPFRPDVAKRHFDRSLRQYFGQTSIEYCFYAATVKIGHFDENWRLNWAPLPFASQDTCINSRHVEKRLDHILHLFLSIRALQFGAIQDSITFDGELFYPIINKFILVAKDLKIHHWCHSALPGREGSKTSGWTSCFSLSYPNILLFFYRFYVGKKPTYRFLLIVYRSEMRYSGNTLIPHDIPSNRLLFSQNHSNSESSWPVPERTLTQEITEIRHTAQELSGLKWFRGINSRFDGVSWGMRVF